MPPHQHCVTKPATAALRYWSSSRKRDTNADVYGRARSKAFMRGARSGLGGAVQIVKAGDHFLDRGIVVFEIVRHLRAQVLERAVGEHAAVTDHDHALG